MPQVYLRLVWSLIKLRIALGVLAQWPPTQLREKKYVDVSIQKMDVLLKSVNLSMCVGCQGVVPPILSPVTQKTNTPQAHDEAQIQNLGR